MPQFIASVLVFTHSAPHIVASQVQVPMSHVPKLQRLPHIPQ
jgi:hypothetical protein